MMTGADHEGMTAVFFVIFLVALGPLAVCFGTDSRRPTDRRSL